MNDSAAWFTARLLFEALHPDEPDGARLFEDRLILLRAENDESASRRAKLLGKKAREEYRNEYGARVIWEFVELLDLTQLTAGEIADGTEVYGQFLDEQDLKALKRTLEPGKLGAR